MGNAVGSGSKKAKVMKIDGETMTWKTPARANDVVKEYPGHVLLDSEAVKHFGLRAKPLEPNQDLKPKKLYFLVELPKPKEDHEMLPRRVRSSGIRGMNAKDRLDFLMLSKRSVSDLSIAKNGPGPGPTTVRMRLPKAQLEKLVEESHDGGEVAEKIISLYIGNNAGDGGTAEIGGVPPRVVCVIFAVKIKIVLPSRIMLENCVYFFMTCLREFSTLIYGFPGLNTFPCSLSC